MIFALTIPAELNQYWPVFALAVLTILYVAVIRPMKSKKKKDPLDGHARPSLSHERNVEREMNNLLVELSNMSRQITAQLDTRAKKLEVLIDEADQRIVQLENLGGRSSENEITTLLTPPITEPAPPEEPEPTPTPMPLPPVQISPAMKAQARREETNGRHTEIYSLADQGKSALEIATQLKQPRGEIELILALRPK